MVSEPVAVTLLVIEALEVLGGQSRWRGEVLGLWREPGAGAASGLPEVWVRSAQK